MFQDMKRSARVPTEEARVRRFISALADTVTELESWGLRLDRGRDGQLTRRFAGGLSEPRIVSSRDQIGAAVVKILRRQVEEARIELGTHVRVVDLQPIKEGFLLTLRSGGTDTQIASRAVVCCTGGLSYRRAATEGVPTTNPPNDNHVLYDVLAKLPLPRVHEGFFQYHPFGLLGIDVGKTGKCVPETIVNFPVRLLDKHRNPVAPMGEDRLLQTRRILETIQSGRGVEAEDGTGVWLTLGDLEPEMLAASYPKLHGILSRAGMLGRDTVVRPFLHYQLGGFAIGQRCETDLPGLFLAGEITGGLHGRNRLMGTGLTDSLVHGRIAGTQSSAYVRSVA
jgi:succinate dehydrogenase / fumarate reductase flavoprotein subunit/L-aspartate oxidase